MHAIVRTFLIVLLSISWVSTVSGQYVITNEKDFLRAHISMLASPAMKGRGYVQNGTDLAASFMQRKFSEFKLRPVLKDSTYVQPYTFPVNTFPGKMLLEINGKQLKAGDDYIIDAASPSFSRKGMKLQRLDMIGITDSAALQEALAKLDDTHAYVLDHVDSMCKVLHMRKSKFAAVLPAGCYIIPEPKKLTWTVAERTINATVFYVFDSLIPKQVKTLTVDAQAKFIDKYRSENVIGMVPGKIKDSFIVFSAHYDHLGMMGDQAIFPGASDNASGSAMLLYLASYFSAHPLKYSVLFIAFSGEEAGLEGSRYYVAHPAVPLGRIKFLTNIDIMGDASNGVTVVNATEFPDQFQLMNRINDSAHYIPSIYSRGKAANSDHYMFSEAGVPAFFIYSDGGKGYYHDVFDKPEELSLNNVDGVAKLLIDFAKSIK